MTVDRNLFMYDLAVVAMLYNEGKYLKEWLDYHLLAGVEHFYIYDHDSTDDTKEILQPYIENNLVTYIFYPGNAQYFAAYDDAIKKFRFSCRYMAFIDGDEFIFPQENKSITEVVDEILAGKNNVGALAINWHMFGSNFQEKADFSRGVLERFTRRSSDDNPEVVTMIKNIIVPTHTDFFDCPHKINHFEGCVSVDENGKIVLGNSNSPLATKKIVINHYHTKSLEEYLLRRYKVGSADLKDKSADEKDFEKANKNSNEIFDDGILKYRDEKILTVNNIYGGGIG